MNNLVHGYRSAKTLSQLAMGGIGLYGLAQIFAGLIGVAQIIDPNRSLSLDGAQDSSFWIVIQSLLALLQFPVYIFSIIVFLMWLHRIYTNLPALRSDNTEYTPGWAVGYWFIPFVNLVRPFQVVRNAWAESDPDIEPEMTFLTSTQPGAPGFMSLWWGLWITANIFSNITARLLDPEDIRTVEISGYFFVLSGILWGIDAILAIKVIREITDRQEQRIGRVGMLQQMAPPPPPVFGQPE